MASVDFDRWSDSCNPLLIRELRQLVRNGWFVGLSLIFLILLWALTIFVTLAFGDALTAFDGGGYLFLTLIAIVTTGICLYVPVAAFLSAAAEFQEHTLELLAITGVSAFRIVWGKLGAGAVTAALVYAISAPFLCICYSFRGIGAYEIVVSFAMSICAITVSLFAGVALGAMAGHSRQDAWKIPGLVLVLLLGVFVSYVFWEYVRSLLGSRLSPYSFLCPIYPAVFFTMTMTAVATDKFTVRYARPPRPPTKPSSISSR